MKIIQELLAKYQNETISINGTNIEVLIENKIPEQNKLFGRNKYFNSVIADGDEKHIGKLVKVNINNFNRNTLFGKITNLNNKAAIEKFNQKIGPDLKFVYSDNDTLSIIFQIMNFIGVLGEFNNNIKELEKLPVSIWVTQFY